MRRLTILALSICVAILFGIALFPLFSTGHGEPRGRACISNLKNIGMSLYLYASDYDELWPPGEDAQRAFMNVQVPLHTYLQPYLAATSVWRCPQDTGHKVDDLSLEPIEYVNSCFETYGSSYRYRSDLSAEEQALAGDSAKVGLLADYSGAWHAVNAEHVWVGMDERRMQRALSRYWYVVLFADTHVRLKKRDDLFEAWQARPGE